MLMDHSAYVKDDDNFEKVLDKNHPKIKATRQNLIDIKKLRGTL